MQSTYRIPEDNLSTLQSRIAKLVRRCNRAKIEAPVLTVGEFEEVQYKNKAGFDRVRRVYTVTLESAGRPKIGGYEFAAVISPVTDESGAIIGNVLRHVPGFETEIPAQYRNATNYCDHCKTDRRRNETFLIHSEAGFRQIGRNCLALYLGMTDPETLAAMAEILISADDLCSMAEGDESFGGGHSIERLPMDEVLAVGAACIRLFGWLSNKSAREFEKTSTSTLVSNWIFSNYEARQKWELKPVPTDEDKALADAVTEWMGNITDAQVEGNDYMYTLRLLAKSVSVEAKNFGFVISAIAAYSRDKEFAIRRNARIEADTKSEFIGTVGERMEFTNLTVLVYTTWANDYGVTHFYKFSQGDNIIVYKASNDMKWAQGDVVPSITASVKKHDLRVDKYNPQGVKQTVITRASLPKPPAPKPTKAMKINRKAKALLNHASKTLAHTAQHHYDGGLPGITMLSGDYEAWSTVTNLMWELDKEHQKMWEHEDEKLNPKTEETE